MPLIALHYYNPLCLVERASVSSAMLWNKSRRCCNAQTTPHYAFDSGVVSSLQCNLKYIALKYSANALKYRGNAVQFTIEGKCSGMPLIAGQRGINRFHTRHSAHFILLLLPHHHLLHLQVDQQLDLHLDHHHPNTLEPEL